MADAAPLRVANPMNAGQDCLRPTLRASLLATLSYNEGHNEGPFRFFEQGRVFLPSAGQLPAEREIAAGVVAGQRSEPSWLVDNGPLDFFDAKGMLGSALDFLGVAVDWEPAEDPLFHPGRCARLVAGGAQVGVLGELHPSVVEAFDLKNRPAILFELYLEALLPLARRDGAEARNFRSLTRYPAVHRDLALVVADDVPAGRAEAILMRHRLVERVELFDVYAGANIPAGHKSLAFHVYFRSPERTLTAEEVTRTLDGLLRILQRDLGATLRT